MERIDRALQVFNEGFNCAQAIVCAYGPSYGMEADAAAAIAALFGGGMARTGGTCGAVAGAMMILGLAQGGTGEKEKRAKLNGLAAQFLERFLRRHYSVTCRELLGCDPGSDDGSRFIKEQGLRERLCAGFVKDAALILEEMLDPEKEREYGKEEE